MLLLYLGNVFLVFNFLDSENILLIITISLFIAMTSNKFTNWLISIIFEESKD